MDFRAFFANAMSVPLTTHPPAFSHPVPPGPDPVAPCATIRYEIASRILHDGTFSTKNP
jgi:hypothetical protein